MPTLFMNLKILIPLLFIILIVGCSDSQKSKALESGVHFTLNDKSLKNPVGLLFNEGKYHLFFECSLNENKKDWGHVQSSDLIHWEGLPLIVQGDSYTIFGNGSVVIDWNNTCGLGKNNSPMVAICPSVTNDTLPKNQHVQFLTLTYSNNNGISWKKYIGEQIILNDYYSQINDLKVVWHEETQKWIMLVLSGYEICFYSSDNLMNWEYLSRVGEDIYVKTGNWTTIDFFPLEVEETNKMMWVLFISGDTGSPNEGSGIQYFIGNFDGYIYKATRDKPKWLDNGSDNYAGVVLSDYLTNGKPAYYIGCIYNSIYKRLNINLKKSDSFTLARKLRLKDGYDGFSILSEPVETIETIEKEKQLIKGSNFFGELKFKDPIKLPLEINLKFDVNNRLYLGMAEVFGVKVTNGNGDELLIGYHSEKGYFFIIDPTVSQKYSNTWSGFSYATYIIDKTTMDFKVIIDHSSVELFAMDGLITLTRKYSFVDDRTKIALYTKGGNIELIEGNIIELKNIW